MIGSGKRRERAVLSHSASLPFSVHVFVIKERSDPNESNNVIAMSAQEMAKPGIFFILRFYPSLVTLTTPSPTKNKKNKIKMLDLPAVPHTRSRVLSFHFSFSL